MCESPKKIAWWLKLIARDICWQHCISLHVKSPLWGRQGKPWRLEEEEKGAVDVADGRNNYEECFRADRCVCVLGWLDLSVCKTKKESIVESEYVCMALCKFPALHKSSAVLLCVFFFFVHQCDVCVESRP